MPSDYYMRISAAQWAREHYVLSCKPSDFGQSAPSPFQQPPDQSNLGVGVLNDPGPNLLQNL